MLRNGRPSSAPDRAEPLAVHSIVELAGLLPRSASGSRALLGVVGAPGAGKSLFAETVAALDLIEHAVVPMDGFHLADQALAALGLLDRKGAPETFDAHGYAALLLRLRDVPGHTVYAPAFERDLEQPLAGALPIPPSSSLIITEGNYLLLDAPGWRDARSALDEVWFIGVDPEVRRRRLIDRHILFGKSPTEAEEWVRRVDEPNAALVDASRDRADRIFDLSTWHLS